MTAPSQSTHSAFSVAWDLLEDGAPITDVGPLLRKARQEVDELTEFAVRRAIGRETWETIGRSLGMSRQAVQKRYGRP